MTHRTTTHRTTVTAALGAAAAVTFIAGASTTGAPVTLASMSTPLTGYVHTAPPPPAPRNCGPGYVNGVIGGQPKCLRQGQQCQQAHVPDYPRYGFDCAKVGNVFQLHGHDAPPPPPPHKPGPPPPHH